MGGRGSSVYGLINTGIQKTAIQPKILYCICN